MTNPYRAMCAELVAAWDALPWEYDWLGNAIGAHGDLCDDSVVARARALLDQEPVSPPYKLPQPVAVGERLPGPEDCTTNPRTSQGQWCWGWVQHDPAPYSGRWRMMRREWITDEATHWLPANALPTPEATNE